MAEVDFLENYMAPPGLNIKSYGDIDVAHAFVNRIARKHVVHLLLCSDLALHGDGEQLVELGDMSEEYRQWRGWLAEQMMQVAKAVTGEVLSVATVDDGGYLFFRVHELGLVKQVDHLRTFHGRLQYLVDEIRDLQAHFGQLYDNEVDEIMAVVDEVDALDLAVDADKARALELHPLLEIYYFWATPGARIMRGDEESVAELMAYVKRQRQEIDEEEARQRAAREALVAEQYKGDNAGLADAIVEADAQLEETRAEMKRLQTQLEIKNRELQQLGEKRTSLVMSFPDDADLDRALYDAQARSV